MTIKELFREYLRLVIETDDGARVPNQLIDPSDAELEKKGKKHKEEIDIDVNEFSGAGAVAGYTAPLGFDVTRDRKKKSSSK